MLRRRYLLAMGAINAGLLLTSIGLLASCDRLATATLEVRNETDETVIIRVHTMVREEVAAQSTEVVETGVLFGRWGPPGSILIVTKQHSQSRECLWSDVKHNEPLVITSDGVNCDDVSIPFQLPPP